MNRQDAKQLLFLLNLAANSPRSEELLFKSELSDCKDIGYIYKIINTLDSLSYDLNKLIEEAA